MQTITKLLGNTLTIAILIITLSAINAAAATFTVTNTNDSGAGSLRQAILNANATADADTITFDPSVFSTPQTIVLAGTALTITGNATNTLTIDGPGANLLTVSGNDVSRVFVISGATASISGLTVTRGNGVAGILSGNGGGINNNGILTVTNLVVTNNRATGNGGGIHNVFSSSVRLNVINCVISNNVINGIAGNGNGGGINNSSQNISALTITNSIISGNSIIGGNSGGGIFTNGPFNMSGSTVSGNSTGTFGGGISFSEALGASISNSTISGNSATGVGGGISISNSQVAISNSTISGNSSASRGGGINILGQSSLTNSTVVNNTAPRGGGVFNSSSNFNVGNTIIANNSGNTTSPDFEGQVSSLGYNLIENTTGTTFTGTTTGNITGQDPVLGPLQNNGGPTQTHALLSGSPAIDAADPANFPPADQRGVARPLDGDGNGSALPDIGAFERQPDTTPANQPPVANDQNETIEFNTARTFNLNVSDPDANDTLTFAITVAPTKGTVTFDVANRRATYTPNAGATGADSFTYRVTDAAGASDTATVNIFINTAPNAAPVANDQTEAIAFNTARTFALNVSDPDAGDTLTFVIVTPPTKGSVTFNAAARTATYTPNAGATGADSFVYRVTDAAGASDTATVSINIANPPQTGPTEVTGSVRFEASGLVVRRGPGRLLGDPTGTITITNTSGSTLNAPLQLVLDNLTPGIVLVNANGITNGDPFITINQPLAAGASIAVRVQFRNPSNLGVNYTPRLFAGSFAANQVQPQTVAPKYRKAGIR